MRLTYNLATDRRPSWLLDGTGLIYSAQQLDRADTDVCLALLPPTGGTQRQLWCDVPTGADALDAIESAVLGPGGRLGFVNAISSAGDPGPARQDIAVAPSLDPANAQRVRSLPNIPQQGTVQTSAEHLRWLDESRLVYVDQRFHIRRDCSACPVDTIRIGTAVKVLNVDTPGAEPFSVPGTNFATGAAIWPGGNAVLYTLAGDSRVHYYGLADGLATVAHDFGAAGIARDIHVSGNRMVAVVGGRLAVVNDLDVGPVQWDSGGVLHVVDLESGADLALDPAGRVYRRPALSPAADQLAAEAYPILEGGTFVGRDSDLYLFGAP